MLEQGRWTPEQIALNQEYYFLGRTFPTLLGQPKDRTLAEGLIVAQMDPASTVWIKTKSGSIRSHFAVVNPGLTEKTKLPGNEVNVIYVNDHGEWFLQMSFFNTIEGNVNPGPNKPPRNLRSGVNLLWQSRQKSPFNISYYVEDDIFEPFWFDMGIDEVGVKKVEKLTSKVSGQVDPDRKIIYERAGRNWDRQREEDFQHQLNKNMSTLSARKPKISVKDGLAQIYFKEAYFMNGGELPEFNMILPVQLTPVKI